MASVRVLTSDHARAAAAGSYLRTSYDPVTMLRTGV